MGYMLLCGAGSGGASAPTVTLSTANLLANATSITITGTNFSTTAGNNSVTFNNSVTGTVTSATSTSLTVTSLSGVSSLSNGTSLTAIVTTNGQSSGAAVQVATIQVTPATIFGANLIAWYRSDQGLYKDAGITPVSADGDAVYQWNDLSGNNYHLIQVTLANRPTWKTGQINGQPTVRFNGSSNFLLCSAITSLPQPFSVIFVCKPSSTVGFTMFDGVSSSNRAKINSSSSTWQLFVTSTLTGPTQTTNWVVLNTLFNNASSGLHINGNSDTTGAVGAAQNLTGITIGNNYALNAGYFPGDIPEIIIASGNSLTLKSQADTYCDGRYAIY